MIDLLDLESVIFSESSNEIYFENWVSEVLLDYTKSWRLWCYCFRETLKIFLLLKICTLFYLGAAYLSGKLYVIGGHSPEGPLASVERLDAKQEKWFTLKPLNSPRFLLGACAVEGIVYAIGGRNNEQSLDTVEIYDPKIKTWRLQESKMAEPRNDFGLAVKGSEIYCVGGRGVRTIECVNVQTKEWKTVGSTGENNFSISCVFYSPL